MKHVIYNIGELTDSRQLLEANKLKYAIIFTYMIIALLIAFLIWAYFGEIDITVKVNGIVRPINEANRVMNECGGKVEYTYIKNGQQVKESQVLYSIDHSELDLQKSSLEEKIKEINTELERFDKLKKSINDKKNYFDEDSEDEKIFYNKYLQYETEYKDELAKNELVQNQIQDIDANLNNFKLLQQSIDKNENYCPKDSSFYNQFEDYKLNIKQHQDKVNEAERNYNMQQQLGEANAVPENDVTKSKNELESAQDELKKYKNQYTLTVQQDVDKYEEKFKETQNTVTNKITLNQIAQIDVSIKDDKGNLKSLNDSLNSISLNIDKCVIKSPINGVINTPNEIAKGDMLQSGSEVATIIPDDISDYKVQLYVLNKDIGNIKEGQNIKYHFTSLPYQEYGYLEGTILKISLDSTADTKTGESFYLVEASVENKPLYSYKKEKSEIKIGMNCEANIITERKKVLYYLFEKLNLNN